MNKMNKAFDAEAMTMDELREALIVIMEKRAQVQDALEAAKIDAKAQHGYDKMPWVRHARRTLQQLGIESSKVQSELGKRKEKERHALPQLFCDVARDRLAPSTFSEIMDEAHQLLRG